MSKFYKDQDLDIFMQSKSLFLELTGELPFFKIVDFLMGEKGMEFTKEEIAKGARISRTSLFNHWHELEENNIVKITKKHGKQEFYTINSKNQIVKKFFEIELELIKKSLDAELSKQKIVV